MTFTLIETRAIPEINTIAKIFFHDGTGARILSLSNDDENKCFGINFRTPPHDSTGVAHIMEHSVLCGSRKYPVKEPFVEILKGSLQTFVNAFTFPDKTCYPCASQNLKDFYNLIDIYLDAVFYPNINENTMRQEGWHYEIDTPESPLTYKGVVFNEMKGAYSSPDELLGDQSRRSLFPDNTYRFDSGGDPADIPNLTFEAFKAFHDTYYHPSNSFIYFYGDDPEDERLRILESWLKDFDRKDVASLVPLQSSLGSPRKVTYPYDAGSEAEAKAHLSINWLLTESVDVQSALAFSVLAHILLETPASPLKRILMESGLGEDVIGGFQEQLRQNIFSAGLKGIQPENLDKVETLILESLANLALEGLDSETVAASLNTVEFLLREQNTGRFPRGLAAMLNALTTWVYDGNPIDALAFEAPLQAIKERAAGGRYFESLIESYLLKNLHRSTVILLPDPQEGKRREAQETERLEAVKARLSSDALQVIIKEVVELKERQDAPNTPEALATIPSLSLYDLDRNIKVIPSRTIQAGGAPLYFHDIFTNGILYLDLGFDMRVVPEDLLPYAGLLGRLLLEMGTERDDFVRLSQRIGRDTGGIHSATLASTIRGSQHPATWFFLRAKAVVPQASALFELLNDILLTARFDQPERFKQIILERKAGLEASLVPGGSAIVNQRLRARFTQADWLSDQMGGLAHLFFLRNLLEEMEKDWPAVLARLENLRHLLVNRGRMVVNVTLDEKSFKSLESGLVAFIENLPTLEATDANWAFTPSTANEGLTIPAQVNYVGKGANIYKLGYNLDGSVQVINNYLQTTWMWEKVRVQGGAYGGHSVFDMHSGAFTFVSYRDPNLLASLNTYDATGDFLENLEISQAELTKAIIGTVGDLDAYLLPDAKGWTSLTRQLLAYDDTLRQQFRDQVLGTTPDDFKAFGAVLKKVAESGEVVVLGSAEAIARANQERDGFLEVKKVL